MNKFCRLVQPNVPDYLFANVRVPANETLHAGDIIVADTLDSALSGNFSVYVADKVADATAEYVAIVLNGGFETLADGRRPDGQPNYGQYEFKAGDVCTVVRLVPELRLSISKDSLATGANPVVGGNLIPVNDEYALAFSSAVTPVTTKNYLKVEAVENFRIGGQFGAEFATAYIVRSLVTDSTTAPSV